MLGDLTMYSDIPFDDHGRSHHGVDCWGLVALIYREQYGIEVTDYGCGYKSVRDADDISLLVDAESAQWHEIPSNEARPGDVVLFRILGKPTHVGIYVGSGYVMHAERGVGVVIESLERTRWRRRIVAIYRHKDLMDND